VYQFRILDFGFWIENEVAALSLHIKEIEQVPSKFQIQLSIFDIRFPGFLFKINLPDLR